jgi:hypothetical protein
MLTMDKDYPQWEEQVFNKKLEQQPGVMELITAYAAVLWSALDIGVQERCVLNIDKSAGDQAMPKAIFMSRLWKKEGALEWLLFNLAKMCRCHEDTREQRALKILYNATVHPSGNNIALVLNEMITAGDFLCGPGEDKYPYSLAVHQLVRSLQYCRVQNAKDTIRSRQIETHHTNADGNVIRSFLPYDITNERDAQHDRLANGSINWRGRWDEIKCTATQLIASISGAVKQDPQARDHFPVFIAGWVPMEIGTTQRKTGPQPPQEYQRGRSEKRHHTPRHERSNSRSADSRSKYTGYSSDAKSHRSYDSKHTRDHKRTKHTISKTTPPSTNEQREWYKQKNTCLFCGETRHHTRYVNCPARNAHHPNWEPNWDRIRPTRTEAYAMDARNDQNNNKYTHMNNDRHKEGHRRERDRDLSRGRGHSRDRDQGRERSRSVEPSRSQGNLPGPPPHPQQPQAPKQINL